MEAIRIETTFEHYGNIVAPGVVSGDSVEIIVLFAEYSYQVILIAGYRARFAESMCSYRQRKFAS